MFKIFRAGKGKEKKLSEAEKRWNKLWKRYENSDDRNDPVFYLCGYYSEINGEGHEGFLDNNSEEIKDYVSQLKKVLPDDLYNNFYRAYEAYFSKKEDTVIDEICDSSDEYFYQHETEIIEILQQYADKSEN